MTGNIDWYGVYKSQGENFRSWVQDWCDPYRPPHLLPCSGWALPGRLKVQLLLESAALTDKKAVWFLVCRENNIKLSWSQVASQRPSSGADLSETRCRRKPQLCFPGEGRTSSGRHCRLGAKPWSCLAPRGGRVSHYRPGVGTEGAPAPRAGSSHPSPSTHVFPPRAVPAPRAPRRAPLQRRGRPSPPCFLVPCRRPAAGVAVRPGEHRPLFLQFLPPPPSPPPPPPSPPSPPHYSSHSLGRGECVRFAGAIRKWQLARWRCSESRRTRCEGRGAAGRASHRAAHQPNGRRRRRPEGLLSAPSSLCASSGSAPGAVGTPGAAWRAQAGGVGCFREPHFLREPVDSTPRSSLELPPSLSFSFRKWWGGGLGSQRRECAGARAAPRLPLPATPGRVCVSSGRGSGGANFPGA